MLLNRLFILNKYAKLYLTFQRIFWFGRRRLWLRLCLLLNEDLDDVVVFVRPLVISLLAVGQQLVYILLLIKLLSIMFCVGDADYESNFFMRHTLQHQKDTRFIPRTVYKKTQ